MCVCLCTCARAYVYVSQLYKYWLNEARTASHRTFHVIDNIFPHHFTYGRSSSNTNGQSLTGVISQAAWATVYMSGACEKNMSKTLYIEHIPSSEQLVRKSWISSIIRDDVDSATEILNKASAEEKHALLEGKLYERKSGRTRHGGINPGLLMSRYCPETAWWVCFYFSALQWRHSCRGGVSNHQPHDCLLNRLFRRRSKKHQSSASLALVWGIHRWPVNSPHKWPLTRKISQFDDVIMNGLVQDCGIPRARV